MTKAIGPTFGDELATAGLTGLPFAWSASGSFSYGAAMTEQQIAAVAAVYAAHDPDKASPDALFAEKLASGLAVTSSGTPAVSATYRLDAPSQDQLYKLATYAARRSRLPGGGSTFPYPDVDGAPHDHTVATLGALLDKVVDYVFALTVTRDTLNAGGEAEWPAATATIA